ncbi:nicotinate-nucleotide adenylyltransferase [Mucilaginibacter sp. 14171R-50]|nr:nicotinate-nucleotide adenylyltransferase [Mucilaginibacter sp. 14171R-50]
MLIAGPALQVSAQINLPEVRIIASTYKYLNATDNRDMSQPVRMLELKAASYDVKKSEFYDDDYDGYYISFYIPDGKILAAYDKDGKLLRTAEKFKNTKLPSAIRDAVNQRFPNWRIAEDIYQVYYYDEKEQADKTFKLLLENGNKRLKVKINEKGEFL